MRVIGIDPGYAIVGYGVVDARPGLVSPVTFGAVTTEAHTLFEDRLHEIYDDICQLLAQLKPEVMAVETLFFGSNTTTAVAVAEARGVLLLAARQAGLEVHEYSPMQVKMAVAGYGKAGKTQVQQMTQRLLKLRDLPKPDDAADALAIALCHAQSIGSMQHGRGKTKRQLLGYD